MVMMLRAKLDNMQMRQLQRDCIEGGTQYAED